LEIRNIDKALTSATSGGVNAFSRGLTSGLSLLRTIAYVLPGIGLAGIFNLAGEAIMNAAESMGAFDDEVKKLLEHQIEVNKLYKEFFDLAKSISETYSTPLGANQQGNDLLELSKAQEKSSLTRLNIEREILKEQTFQSQEAVRREGGFQRELEARKKVISAEGGYRFNLNKSLNYDPTNNPNNTPKPDPKDLELSKAILDNAKDEYNKIKGINESFAAYLSKSAQNQAKIDAYIQEQKNKAILDSAKIKLESVKAKNKVIIDENRSTEKQILDSIDKIAAQRKIVAEAELTYVKSRPDYYDYAASSRQVDGTVVLGAKTVTKEGETAPVHVLSFFLRLQRFYH